MRSSCEGLGRGVTTGLAIGPVDDNDRRDVCDWTEGGESCDHSSLGAEEFWDARKHARHGA